MMIIYNLMMQVCRGSIKDRGIMKRIFFICSCLFLMGCTTMISATNKLNIGMSKQEVIGVLGEPQSSKASENEEVWEYQLLATDLREHEEFWAVFKDGRLAQYGKAGDFLSASPGHHRRHDMKER